MSNIPQWSTTASSNNSASPNGWPENMAPSGVNNSARENMAAIAKWYGDSNGALVTAGIANTYTLATNSTNAALADQCLLAFRVNVANTGATTLNVDGLGAKSVKLAGVALESGQLPTDSIITVIYNATNDEYDLLGGFSPTRSFTGVVNLDTGSNIASASTINLDTATGNLVHITGTTTITAATLTKGPRMVIFDGILTLTHHATNNNLPTASNITTAAGDRALYWADGTTVYCSYFRANGSPLASTSVGDHEVVVTTGNGHGSTNNKIRRYTTTQSSVGSAITYADSSTDGGSFTINLAGIYAMTLTDAKSGSQVAFGISVNSSELTTSIASITDADRLGYTYNSGANLPGTLPVTAVNLSSSDVVRVHTAGTVDSTSSADTVFRIRRIGTA